MQSLKTKKNQIQKCYAVDEHFGCDLQFKYSKTKQKVL